jgi:hypothetical protein
MFGKFMEFFAKGLNPCKSKTILKVDLLPKFLIQIHLEFELFPKRKVVPLKVFYHCAKFGNFWSSIIISLKL